MTRQPESPTASFPYLKGCAMYFRPPPCRRVTSESAVRRLNAKRFARLKELGATLHIGATVHSGYPRNGELRLNAHLYFDLPLKDEGMVVRRSIADVVLLMPGYCCAKDPAQILNTQPALPYEDIIRLHSHHLFVPVDEETQKRIDAGDSTVYPEQLQLVIDSYKKLIVEHGGFLEDLTVEFF